MENEMVTVKPKQSEPNFFRQHIPSFCDGFKPVTFGFSTTEELLSNPWLKDVFSVEGYENYKFCKSKNCLMISSPDETKWWVMGYLKYPEEVNIPKWSGGKNCDSC